MSAFTAAAIGVAVVAAILTFVVAAYTRHWTWTGFAGDARKTLWDWLQLLVVPVALAAVAFGLSVWQDDRQQRKSEEHARGQRAQNAAAADRERKRAENRQRDEILGAYLRDMSGLLLRDDLVDSRAGSEVRRVARALTLTALRRLDADRRTALLRFLIESRLVQRPDVRVNLADAMLDDVDLRDEPLVRIDFQDAHLNGADLRRTYLEGTKFYGADLHNADFRDARTGYSEKSWGSEEDVAFQNNRTRPGDVRDARTVRIGFKSDERQRVFFSDARLAGARFDGAELLGTSFADADLRGASFRNATAARGDFLLADLRGADLTNAYLGSAHLNRACVTGARFVKANLRGATLTNLIGRRTNLTSARIDRVRGARWTILPQLIAGGPTDRGYNPEVLREFRSTSSDSEVIKDWQHLTEMSEGRNGVDAAACLAR